MTDIVILVGGRGSRIKKITNKIPKPLIPIKKKRFLDILLSKIITYNFNNIYLLCSYKKKIFFKLYHKKKIHNSKIFCIDEGIPKDTGGALHKLRNKIKDNFFLINGDSYFDIDFNILTKVLDKKSIGCIAITKNNNYKKNTKINNIKIDNYGFLKFTNSKSDKMNGGVYFFNKKIFKYITNKKSSLENEILRKLIDERKIKGIFFKNKFIDIGSYENINFLKSNLNFLKQKACFLDRDGVINKLLYNDYVKKISEFKFLPNIFKTIELLNKYDFKVIVITNQACVGKSIISEKKLNLIHNYMKSKVIKNNGKIDDIFYSPYYKYSKIKKYRINKNDRKPNSGMLIKAVNKWNIDIDKSFFIGDSLNDYKASKKINLKFFYNKKRGSILDKVKDILK